MEDEDPHPFYFGDPWPSGICDDGTQRPTPVGEECLDCGEAIQEGDQGNWMPVIRLNQPPTREPVHRECALANIRGHIGHLVDHDYWCLIEHTNTAGYTRRESALMVWDLTINGIRPKF